MSRVWLSDAVVKCYVAPVQLRFADLGGQFQRIVLSLDCDLSDEEYRLLRSVSVTELAEVAAISPTISNPLSNNRNSTDFKERRIQRAYWRH